MDYKWNRLWVTLFKSFCNIPVVAVENNDMDECPGRFLGIIRQNPSVAKSNWLHVVVVFQFSIYEFEECFHSFL